MSSALTTNVDKRLLQTTKFPPFMATKVDMKKVHLPVIKKWVSDELANILHDEDDVVTDLVFNLIEGPRFPNIKELQISLTGFLDRDAPKFCEGLWKLCISAQENPNGIPKELLEAKKLELLQEKIAEDKAFEDARKRQEDERERDRDMARIRDRERGERNERGRGRGGRYGRDSDRRPPRRDSRSPPPRRRDGDDFYRAPPPRGTDSYVPPSSRGRKDDRRPPRRRSPSGTRSPIRSRSPPRRRRRNSSSPSRSPPPRRSRRASNDRSASRERGDNRKGKAGDRRRDRSPDVRRRSRSPRRHRRRRSSARANDSRSPPPKRIRRPPPSRSRSPPRGGPGRNGASGSKFRSRSPPSHAKKRASLAANDLMSRTDKPTRNEPRLSRETSSHSETPPAREQKSGGSQLNSKRRNTSSVESNDRVPTNGGAEESGFSFRGTATASSLHTQRATQPASSSASAAPAQPRERQPNQLIKNDLRMKLMKQKIIKSREAGMLPGIPAAPKRKDSGASTDTGKS